MPDGGLVANARQRMDGLVLLRSLGARSAAAVFWDPQYRAGLDALAYGNEGERQIERAKLPQMTDAQIAAFIEEIERVLQPSGHCFLWMDKFSLFSAHWHRWMPDITSLALVDGIAWEKPPPFGMGRRSRGITEYLVVLQKGPRRAKGIWKDHRIADCWTHKLETEELARRKIRAGVLAACDHTHAKPLGLELRLIESVTKRGDLVVDPAAGGYGVLEACRQTRRTFMGCDLI